MAPKNPLAHKELSGLLKGDPIDADDRYRGD